MRALGFTFTHPGPVATKNRIRLLILAKETDVIVKTAAVRMEVNTELDSETEMDSTNMITQEVR